MERQVSDPTSDDGIATSASEQRIVELGQAQWKTKKKGADLAVVQVRRIFSINDLRPADADWNGWVHIGQALDSRPRPCRARQPQQRAQGPWLQ
jgi:hypothetical protein